MYLFLLTNIQQNLRTQLKVPISLSSSMSRRLQPPRHASIKRRLLSPSPPTYLPTFTFDSIFELGLRGGGGKKERMFGRGKDFRADLGTDVTLQIEHDYTFAIGCRRAA